MEKINILSWDVGIKHLAYNLSEYIEIEGSKELKLTIKQWGIINLSLEQCSFCDKDGSYIYEELYYCTDHCKKLRQKHFCYMEKCYDKAKYNINNEKEGINKYMCENHGPKTYSNDVETQSLKLKLIEKLDKMQFENFTYLLIENQPTFKNPKMKAIADTLYAWFLIRKIVDEKILLPHNIKLISPGRKMKLFETKVISKTKKIKETKETKEVVVEEIKEEVVEEVKNSKLSYKDGKKMAIDLTLSLINDEWKLFFNEYSKKDDLADSLLQGYSFYTDIIEEKYEKIRQDAKKETTKKNKENKEKEKIEKKERKIKEKAKK